jgi:signal transduction histidine kinase
VGDAVKLLHRLDVQLTLIFVLVLSIAVSITGYIHRRGHLINIVGPFDHFKEQFAGVEADLRNREGEIAVEDFDALVTDLRNKDNEGYLFIIVDEQFNILAETKDPRTYLEMVRPEVEPGTFVVTTSTVEKRYDFILFYRKVPGFSFTANDGVARSLIIIPKPWLIDPPPIRPVLFEGLRNHFNVFGWFYAAVILFFIVFIRYRLRPLRYIEAASLDMTNRIPPPIPLKTKPDEVGKLVQAFNTALQRLADNEAVRQRMVSDIAHELRTPLTNLSGRIEAYEDHLIEDADALIRFTSEQVNRLKHIVEDLSLLTSFDAGTLELHPERFDLRDELEKLLATGSLGADYQWNLTGDAVEVDLDLYRFRQAMDNLITNAVQAMPRGLIFQVRIAIDADGVTLTLEDNGPGVGEEHLPHLFDRLYRVDSGRADNTGGSGLGLSIVKSLVEAQQGAIACYLSEAGGLGFRICFPRTILAEEKVTA